MKVTVYKNGKPVIMEKEFADRLVAEARYFSYIDGPEPREEEITVDDSGENEVTEEASLREAYLVKFGKNAPKNIHIDTLRAKLQNNE